MSRDERLRLIISQYLTVDSNIDSLLSAIKQEYSKEEVYHEALEKIIEVHKIDTKNRDLLIESAVDIAQLALCDKVKAVCNKNDCLLWGQCLNYCDGKQYNPPSEDKVEPKCKKCNDTRYVPYGLDGMRRRCECDIDYPPESEVER